MEPSKPFDQQRVFRHIRSLRKALQESEAERKALEKKVDALERSQLINDHYFKEIFKKLDEIGDNTKWIRRTFTGALISGVFGVIVSITVWLIQSR